MLNALFGSTARVKILNFLLLNEEQAYELSALSKELSLSSAALRHELNNLVGFGLLKEEIKFFDRPVRQSGRLTRKKNRLPLEKKFFLVRRDFLLYPEIKALFSKAQILSSQKFVSGLEKISRPKFLALTGLFTNYPEAQTDILFVGTLRRPAFLKLLKELERDLGREINYTILNEREFNYRRSVMDIFLYNILEGKTLVLINNLETKKNL